MATMDAALREAHRKIVEDYMGKSGVNGVAIGFKSTGGRTRRELSVRVYVTRKRPKQYLPAAAILPDTIKIESQTILIDVVEGGPFYPLSYLSLADETRSLEGMAPTGDLYITKYRPVPYGVSMGHYAITAGTSGCLVTDNTDNSVQLLSNNHVLANINNGQVGDPIVQPGAADGGSVEAGTVAVLKRFVRIETEAPNYVDAAIATPVSPDLFVNSGPDDVTGEIDSGHPVVGLLFAGGCSGRIIACRASRIADELDISFPSDPVEPLPGMIVEKVGRTTGWTVSQITDTHGMFHISYGESRVAYFTDVFVIPAFGHAGDSGSAILRGEL